MLEARRRRPSLSLLMGILLFVGLLAVIPSSPAAVASCPTYTVMFNSFNYFVTVSGANGSCPTTFSLSGILHLVLSTAGAQNPYTVVVSPDCSTSTCTPNNIVILGWANIAICGTSQSLSAAPCSTNGPWSGSLDATVQANQACNTAPLKINGNSGIPQVIFEAGVGGDCAPSAVPEFQGSPLLIAAALFPALLLLRRRSPKLF